MRFREQYHQDGFVAMPSLVSLDQVAAMNKEIDRLVAEHPACCTYEDWRHGNEKKVLHKISRFIEKSAVFKTLATADELLNPIREVFGEDPCLCTDKINFKLSGGRGFYPHQDMSGVWSKYVSHFLTAFIALDASDADNGCLQVAKGRHKEGMFGPFMKPMEEAHVNTMHFTNVPQQPGDVLFFDGYLPHQSAPNRTAHSRRVLLLTYTRSSDGDLRVSFLGGQG